MLTLHSQACMVLGMNNDARSTRLAGHLAANTDLNSLSRDALIAEDTRLAGDAPSRFNDSVDRKNGLGNLGRRLAIRHLLAS